MKWNDFFTKHKDSIRPFSRMANYGPQVKHDRKELVLDLLDNIIKENPDIILYAVYEVDGKIRISADLPSILNGEEYTYFKKIRAINKIEEYINKFF